MYISKHYTVAIFITSVKWQLSLVFVCLFVLRVETIHFSREGIRSLCSNLSSPETWKTDCFLLLEQSTGLFTVPYNEPTVSLWGQHQVDMAFLYMAFLSYCITLACARAIWPSGPLAPWGPSGERWYVHGWSLGYCWSSEQSSLGLWVRNLASFPSIHVTLSG